MYTSQTPRQIFLYCFLVFPLLSFNCPIKAQDPSALVVQFDHTTHASLAYPDYFEDKVWTESVMDYLRSWLKKRYAVTDLHYKRQKPISFTPVLGREEAIKSLSRTGFDYGLQILSSLESGLFDRKMRDNEARLSLKVRLYDDRGKVVFKGQVFINILIKLQSSFQGYAYIGRQDFQELYLDALKMATYSKRVVKFFQFDQPQDEEIMGFVQNGQHYFLQRTSRGRYDLQISPDSSVVLNLLLENPEELADGFVRGATWENPLNAEKVQTKGKLNPRFPDEIRLELLSNDFVLGQAQSRYYAEEYVLNGTLKGVNFKYSKNLRQPVFGFYLEDELWALGILKDQAAGRFERYDVFLKPQANPEDLALFMHVLGLETTREAVRKFYQVETEE